MPKKSRKAPIVNLADFKKKLEEEHSLVIRTPDGDFRYRGPQLLSDDEMLRMTALEESEEPDAAVEVARIMVDDYDGFVEAGGSLTILMEIVAAEARSRRAGDDDDVDDSGESEASSGS